MKKLDHKRLGPFVITQALGRNAYRLKLPKTMKVHPVFSVVKLRRYHPNEIPERRTYAQPPPIVVNDTIEYEVAKIHDSRVRRGRLQYLIQWRGYPLEDNSWEPATTVMEDVPALVKKFHTDHPSMAHTIGTTSTQSNDRPVFHLTPEQFRTIPFRTLLSDTCHTCNGPFIARRDTSP